MYTRNRKVSKNYSKWIFQIGIVITTPMIETEMQVWKKKTPEKHRNGMQDNSIKTSWFSVLTMNVATSILKPKTNTANRNYRYRNMSAMKSLRQNKNITINQAGIYWFCVQYMERVLSMGTAAWFFVSFSSVPFSLLFSHSFHLFFFLCLFCVYLLV